MPDNKDINKFFDTKLKKKIEKLEPLRKKIKIHNIIFLSFIFIFIIIGLYFAITSFLVVKPEEVIDSARFIKGILIALSSVLVIIIYYIIFDDKTPEFVSSYKRTIIKSIVKFIDKKWKYNKRGKIKSSFSESKLFANYTVFYEDSVTGTVGDTKFEFCEIKAQSVKSFNITNKKYISGVFFTAEFNKNFNGETFVLPDKIEGKIGKNMAQKAQSAFGENKLIKLEDIEFEKLFKVYSTDQIEARYILTPQIMRALVHLNNLGSKISVSFIKSRIYFVVVLNDFHLFEPKIFSSNLNFKDVKKIYTILNIIPDIISKMSLNTRIWTKE